MNRRSARRSPRTTQRFVHGFTLIEVMIVVAIIAILTAVAVPSYRDYIVRSRLADARHHLATLAARMEQHYQDNRFYTTTSATTTCGITMPSAVDSPYFAITCAANFDTALPANQSYRLTAVGSGAVTGFTFTITHAGVRATTAAPAGWGTNAGCWITRRGAVC